MEYFCVKTRQPYGSSSGLDKAIVAVNVAVTRGAFNPAAQPGDCSPCHFSRILILCGICLEGQPEPLTGSDKVRVSPESDRSVKGSFMCENSHYSMLCVSYF